MNIKRKLRNDGDAGRGKTAADTDANVDAGVVPDVHGKVDVGVVCRQWCTEGNEHIGKRERRYVFNSRGELTAAADGIIAGWLRKEKGHFFPAKTCKPVWRLMYDDAALGEENLDEHEVLKAISLMSKELPACIAAQQAKPTSSCNDKCNRPSSGLSLGGSGRKDWWRGSSATRSRCGSCGRERYCCTE
jgi:hypothetical protein